jgi:hypothetical protein
MATYDPMNNQQTRPSGHPATHHTHELVPSLDLPTLRALLRHAFASGQFSRDLLGFPVAVRRWVTVRTGSLHPIDAGLLVDLSRLGPFSGTSDASNGLLIDVSGSAVITESGSLRQRPSRIGRELRAVRESRWWT